MAINNYTGEESKIDKHMMTSYARHQEVVAEGMLAAKEERTQAFTEAKERREVFVVRDCNKCINHISGNCSAWNCKGTVTIEDVKAEAYEQGKKDAIPEGMVLVQKDDVAKDLYRKGFRKGYEKGIDDFSQAFIEEGLRIKHLRHIWIQNTCNLVAERLKGQKK